MIKILILLFLVFMIIMVLSCDPETIKGNGNIVESDVTISPFETINCDGSAEVRFHKSEEYGVLFSIDSNLEEYVEIFTNNNKALVIRMKRSNSYQYTNFVVNVYAPTLNGISLSGSCSFNTNETIETENFEIAVTGSGNITGKLESNRLTTVITGSGRINLEGKSEDTAIRISGSGNFNGESFVVNNANINISGSGNISMNVLENLNVRISGSGRVRYSGNPNITSNISGSGRLIKMD
ncbi:MAG: DUF2807 domain-containing protein [Candidatus Cloacimonetes bacterium]|nr:DUF2807 domain-containing protein [Candidatus Cloacimonadota bacterium]